MGMCIAQAKGWKGRSGYRKGCRCRFCKSDWAAYKRESRKRPEVKAARRDRGLRSQFGITLNDYNDMLAAQGGVCAICRNPQTGRNQFGSIPLHVDHCHESGRVRGLLCLQCNIGIGQFQNDPARCQAAAEYLL